MQQSKGHCSIFLGSVEENTAGQTSKQISESLAGALYVEPHFAWAQGSMRKTCGRRWGGVPGRGPSVCKDYKGKTVLREREFRVFEM